MSFPIAISISSQTVRIYLYFSRVLLFPEVESFAARFCSCFTGGKVIAVDTSWGNLGKIGLGIRVPDSINSNLRQ